MIKWGEEIKNDQERVEEDNGGNTWRNRIIKGHFRNGIET